jgi:excisionase family DNA binding protein
MELLTIKDVAERTGLPKPTIYRMFNEMNDLIPHKRVGRKILFPEEAIAKITEIRKLTKQEGLTYKMIRDETLVASRFDEKVKVGAENVVSAQLAPRLSEILSRSIAAGFEGLREDLRLLTAQIDRQNDLLSRYLGQKQPFEDSSPPMIKEEFELEPKAIKSLNREKGPRRANRPREPKEKATLASRQASNFRVKWSNFWSGKGWKA